MERRTEGHVSTAGSPQLTRATPRGGAGESTPAIAAASGSTGQADRLRVAPQTPAEAMLAQIWQEVLAQEEISVLDDFFQLGGDSLLAVQAIARIGDLLGVELSIYELFERPTIQELARALTKAAPVPPPIPRLSARSAVPLSSAQSRLWFIDHLEGGGAAYHIPLIARLIGGLDDRALEAAFSTIICRHEVLRTAVITVEGIPVQTVSSQARFAIALVDLRGHTTAHRDAIVHRLVQEESSTPFNLTQGPLIRAKLLRLTNTEHILVITMHHMVADGWSVGLLIRELGALYAAYREERPDPLPPLPIQYADYVEWQRQRLAGTELQKQLDYWKAHLQGAPQCLELPTDRARPTTQSYKGASVSLALGCELTEHLKQLSRQRNLTLAMTLCTAWSIVLSRFSGQTDLVIGMPVANRPRTELEGLIGLFVNTVAVRIGMEHDPALTDLLEEVKASLLGAYAHQDVPFEQVVETLRPERSLSHNPIFQVMFVMQNAPRDVMQLSGLTVVEQEVPSQTAQFDLLLSLQETKDDIVGTLNYASDLFDAASIERWVRSLKAVLIGMVRNPHRQISKLPILSEEDRRQLVESVGASEPAATSRQEIHRIFEQRARLAPDTVAMVDGSRRMTYGELNRRANQLAHYLQEQGVRTEHPVAVCVERGLDMVIAVLGILKAGGAYLPLDPLYPIERLRFVLRDAAPRVLLTTQELSNPLASAVAQVIVLDTEWKTIATRPADEPYLPQTRHRSAQLAYVIYTSGSTGEPKGVMVSHENVTRLFATTQTLFNFSERDVWTLFHSLAFDFSVWELWGALLYGGSLVVVPHFTARTPQEFYRLLCDEGVTVLNQTPSAFVQLIDAQTQCNGMEHALRVVIFGGEALEPHMVQPWFERNGSVRPLLINMYGITETTVHVTYRPICADGIQSERTSLIGKPIPDLRTYLLDQHREPVPVGVIGEIYVGGPGVARGYLNRPELTANRFIADPFTRHTPARLYMSGDLGRWRSDGTIEYLGRNDQQVKIRGFRIELGEVQAQLASLPQVRDAVVLVREDTAGDKRLVAYVIPNNPLPKDMTPSAQDLRAHLKSVLPEHMIPSVFLFIESFPLTPNGKLDRRALPAPNLHAHARRQYAAPQGAVEQSLAAIWQALLAVSQVGRDDNFFDLGGHSFTALRLVFEVTRAFKYTLTVTDVYRNPTLQELATRIGGEVSADHFVSLSKEAALDDEIIVPSALPAGPLQALLLTGATGFVGRFLLAQLLQETQSTIYCLVRARSPHEAASRLKTTLLKWDLWSEGFEHRAVAIPGDLKLPRLGLDQGTYERVSAQVDIIYHCATSMNHLETYSMAKATNVDAARELLKLATRGKSKLINYISTLGIFSTPNNHESRAVNERSPIDHELHRESAGYAASKWVGEKLFLTASARGVRCNIFRLGLVWADTRQGRYDELQRGDRIFMSCLLSGYGIKDYQFEMPPTPVDYVARALVYLGTEYAEGNGIFHLSSPDHTVNGVFERCNEIANTSLHLVPFYEWIQQMKRANQHGTAFPAVPLVEFAFSMDQATFEEHQRLVRPDSIQFDCARTYHELEQGGIAAPVLDDALLKLYVDNMLARNAELRHCLAARQYGVAQLRSSAGAASPQQQAYAVGAAP